MQVRLIQQSDNTFLAKIIRFLILWNIGDIYESLMGYYCVFFC